MELGNISLALFVVLLLVVTLRYVRFHIQRGPLYKVAEQFSGPKPLPIVGNAFKCMIPLPEMADAMLMGSSYYKSPARLWFGPYLTVCIWSPEDIKLILNSPYALGKQPYLYKLFEIVLGRGLVTVPVEEWKRRRRLISPNFNQQNLESFFDIFYSHSKVLVDTLKKEEGKNLFDVEHYLLTCVMNIVMESILGIQADERNSDRARDVAEWSLVITSAIMSRISNILYFSDFIFKMSPSGKKLAETKTKFKKLMNSFTLNEISTAHYSVTMQDASCRVDAISDRRYPWMMGKMRFQAHPTIRRTSKPRNFIELLLSSSDEMGLLTTEEVHSEVNTIVIAGLDTTSCMMGYLLVALGMHPEIQEQVHQEILDILETRVQLRNEDIKQFVYLERVIKESLRIFPVLGGFARYSERDIALENHTIPANTNILIGLLSLHRDPNVWPDPTKFDPDRFSPEEEAKRHPYSWIPFSAGPRNCIGLRYALLTMKVMTIQLILNYQISTDYKDIEDVRFTMVPLLKPTNGYKISLRAR